MGNYQFSKQELETLLTQLRIVRVKYPPELLTARRRLYLGIAAQVAAPRASVDIKWKRWISSIMREPGSTIIKVLIAIFVAFLIAYTAHAIATGNVDLVWLIDLLSL